MKIEVGKSQVKLFDRVRFVCQAVSKETTRYAITHVKIEAGHFVATNGERLHIAEIEHEYEPGLYEVIKCNQSIVVLFKDDDAGNFPKWRDIVPEHESYFDASPVNYDLTTGQTVAFGLAQKGIMLNPNWLIPLGSDDWRVYFGEPDRPVLCKSISHDKLTGKSAVLMPVTSPKIDFKAELSKEVA